MPTDSVFCILILASSFSTKEFMTHSSIVNITQRHFSQSLEAVNMNTILALKFVFNACLALRLRERTCTALRGNNRSDFPKGSDTGTKINCSVLKMNKGICAMIKEARVLPPCRPEPTFNKPSAVPACLPACLMDFASMEPQSLTGNRMPYTHIYIPLLQRKRSHMHIWRHTPHPPPPNLTTHNTLYACQCTYT